MISIHDIAAVEVWRQRLRIDPNQLRQARNSFYKKRLTSAAALRQIPEEQRVAFSEAVDFHSLELHGRHDSRQDGATKLLFRTERGQLLESVVLRIASGRTALCISSQIGCAARCEFCATGHMGLAVNLGRAEILDQVVQANQLLRAEGRSIRNVVFMGMGEPFHNETEVYEAVAILTSPRCFDLSPAHVGLSTVGIPDAMVRCAERFPRLGIALSLHSARQEERARLMPLARRYPLNKLREALVEVTARQRRPMMIEYLMLDGRNDSDDDVAALADYLRGLTVHINLIPFNPIDEAPELKGTAPVRRRAFAAALVGAGFVVTMRHSLGADITAACGQLARREKVEEIR